MSYFKSSEQHVPPMPAKIAQAVVDVMGAVGKLTKDNKNSHGGYNYVGIDDFRTALNPCCAAAGLILKPVCISADRFEATSKNGSRQMIRFKYHMRLIHVSGETWTDTDETIPVELGGVTRFISRRQIRYAQAQGDYATNQLAAIPGRDAMLARIEALSQATGDAVRGLVAVVVICALASTLAIRVALKVDPAEAIATLIPMTSASEFRSAPPELPGLMAASVWMTASEIVEETELCCCCS